MPTYVKLQDVYIAEQGQVIGSWLKIGYTGPGITGSDSKLKSETSNFNYEDKGNYTNDTLTFTTQSNGWQATSRVALNDCKKASTWALWTQGSSTEGGILKYKYAYSDEASCSPLTPSFEKIANDGKK